MTKPLLEVLEVLRLCSSMMRLNRSFGSTGKQFLPLFLIVYSKRLQVFYKTRIRMHRQGGSFDLLWLVEAVRLTSF